MKKIFKTTFEEDFIKEVKVLSIKIDCNVNDIFRCCYEYCLDQNKIEEIVKGYK